MTELSDTCIKALPDLTLVVRRDGLVLRNLGGRELGMGAAPGMEAAPGALDGRTLTELWPGELGLALIRLVRRSLKGRETSQGRWPLQNATLEVLVRPQGPDRALLVICSTAAHPPEVSDAPALPYTVTRWVPMA